jgi:peptidoglycan hydrolase FlgJ
MNELKPPQLPSSYHDFAGLGALRGQASRDQREAARETAVQFEAYFVQQMMKTMREAVMKGDLVDTGVADTYQDMMDKELSLSIARGRGLGLATMLEREMLKVGVTSTQDVLKARDASSQTGLPLQRPSTALPLKAPGQGAGLPLPKPAPLQFSQPAYPSGTSRTGGEP